MTPAEPEVVAVGLDRSGDTPLLGRAHATALLDDDERARVARLSDDADRAAFAMAHGLVRVLLGRRLGVDPSHLVITRDAAGRPGLADAPQGPWFSLARRPGAVAVAVHDARVGVDIERCPTRIDVDAVAARFFDPDEIMALAQLGPAARTRAFCALWVRKEAVAKAVSVPLERGLAQPVGGDEVVATDARGVAVTVLLHDHVAPPGFLVASATVRPSANSPVGWEAGWQPPR